jgi:type 1 glutamine amidotransferase
MELAEIKKCLGKYTEAVNDLKKCLENNKIKSVYNTEKLCEMYAAIESGTGIPGCRYLS